MKNRVLIIGYGASGQRYFKIIKKKFPNSEIKVFSKLKKNEKFFLKNSQKLNLLNQIQYLCVIRAVKELNT